MRIDFTPKELEFLDLELRKRISLTGKVMKNNILRKIYNRMTIYENSKRR